MFLPRLGLKKMFLADHAFLTKVSSDEKKQKERPDKWRRHSAARKQQAMNNNWKLELENINKIRSDDFQVVEFILI